MREAIFMILVMAFAFAPIGVAQSQEYNEVTEVGGEPETMLAVKVPLKVVENEEFVVQATVNCEEEKQYDAKITTSIFMIYSQTHNSA
jgi:hypothetical protein